MQKKDNLIKNTGIYAIGLVLSRIAGLIMLPIYTRYLSPADYARIELLLLTTDLTALVIGLGIRQSITRFYYQYSTQNERKTFLSTVMLLSFFLYTTTCVIFFSKAHWLAQLIFDGTPEDVYAFKLTFLLFFLEPLRLLTLAMIQARQKAKLFVVLSLVELVMQLTLNIYFVVFSGYSYIGILYSSLVTMGILAIFQVTYYFKFSGFSFSWPVARNVIAFGAPFIFLNLGNFAITFSDRYFLKAYGDLTRVGIYSLGYKLAFIYTSVAFMPLFSSWDPKRYELASEPTFESTNKSVFTYASLLFIFMALVISIYARDFFRIVAAPAFSGAYKIVPIVLIAYIMQGWTNMTDFGIHFTGQTRSLVLVGIVSTAVIVLSSILLIPPYQEYGAAMATVCAFLARFMVTFYYAQRLYPLSYDWGKVLAMFALAVFIYLISLLAPHEHLVISIGCSSVLVAGYLGLVWVLPILERNEKMVILSFCSDKLKRILPNRI